MPTFPNWLTIVLTGLATATPQILPFIPQPYGVIASAVISAAGATAHLFMQPPK